MPSLQAKKSRPNDSNEMIDHNKVEEADRQLFDSIAGDYVRKDQTPYCRVARKLRLDRTMKNLPKPMRNLLEVGCGAGFTADYLQGTYQSFTGLDYSENLIAYANAYNASDNSRFVCVNVNDFDSAESFQVILMIGVLHHIPEPAQVLEALKPQLASDGAIVVNEPQRGNPLISLMRKIRKLIDPNYSPDQVEFTEKELISMFESSGYSVRSFPQGVLSTPLAETRLLPNVIGLPLAWLTKLADPVLETLISMPLLRRLAWNVVIEARPRS